MFFLRLDVEIALAEAGHGHRDAVLVLADALDIVGGIAWGIAFERRKRIPQRAKPIEADG